MDEDPELAEAFANGSERERQTLHTMLFDAATKGSNIVAAMFLLKSRHGYQEGQQEGFCSLATLPLRQPTCPCQ